MEPTIRTRSYKEPDLRRRQLTRCAGADTPDFGSRLRGLGGQHAPAAREPQGSFGAPEPATDGTTTALNIGDRMSDARQLGVVCRRLGQRERQQDRSWLDANGSNRTSCTDERRPPTAAVSVLP